MDFICHKQRFICHLSVSQVSNPGKMTWSPPKWFKSLDTNSNKDSYILDNIKQKWSLCRVQYPLFTHSDCCESVKHAAAWTLELSYTLTKYSLIYSDNISYQNEGIGFHIPWLVWDDDACLKANVSQENQVLCHVLRQFSIVLL